MIRFNLLLLVLYFQIALNKHFVSAEDNVNGYGCNSYGVCLPGAEDIAVPPRTVTASNTCGQPPGRYCEKGPPSACFMCNSSSSEDRHPADYMIDRSKGYSGSNFLTWWQSQTWWQWLQIHREDPLPVNITISFNKSYLITGEVHFTFKSNKPSKMVLEKSVDFGNTWVPLQYFADDCLTSFGMEPSFLNCSTDAVLCTEKYRDQTPSPGAMSFSFLNCYTRETFWDKKTQDLTYATDLRLRLQFPGTDGFHNIKNEDKLNRYFYAISDIQIFGRCHCNGHAPNCEFPRSSGTLGFINMPSCMCEHRTTGTDCDKCEPLYNNRVWMPATSTTEANPCQKCECYEHASSCTFNNSLGHGVCNDCTHNTTGYFCEQCEEKFYRNLSKPLNDSGVCLDCDCALEGVINNGSCSQQNATIGQCMCKDNVTGRRCDRCEDAYYGYSLPPVGNCIACLCNMFGTVNGSLNCHQQTGECACKSNVHLRTCSQCKLGFYGFPNSTDADCLECNCDYGGSTEEICEKVQGNCLCRNGIQGGTCSNVTDNRFFPQFDYFLYEAEYQSGNYTVTSDIKTYDKYFTGRGYATIAGHQFVGFSVSVDITSNYSIVLRYSDASGNIGIDMKGGSSPTCPFINQTMVISGLLSAAQGVSWKSDEVFLLCPDSNYTIRVYSSDPSAANASISIDSLVLVPQLTELRTYENLGPLVDVCVQNFSTVQGGDASSSTCRGVAFSAMVELFNGSLPCECSTDGSESETCEAYGGQCPCKRGVMGRKCDTCQPGYFNFTDSGCTPCNCHVNGSHSAVCDPISGQCSCKRAVEGRTCHRCEVNFFGLNTGQGCWPCNCNTTGSVNKTCHEVTGKCFCKPGVEEEAIDKCDRCKFAHFNFTEAGCQACNCDEAGSRSLQCHSSGECACKINVAGKKCDRCINGTFALEESNPSGCSPCFCFNRTRNCSSAEGFVLTTITQSNLMLAPDGHIRLTPRFNGNHLRSYGRLFEVNISAAGNFSDEFQLHLKSSRHDASFRLTSERCGFRQRGRYCVLLHETNSEERLAAYEMQSLLVDVEEATLNVTDSLGNGLDNRTVFQFSVGSAVRGVGGISERAHHVEKCTCPESYHMLSCESCNSGFTRDVANSSAFVGCSPCACNGRSETCDPETRICSNCRLSLGPFCETCGYGVDIATNCTSCLPRYWSPDIHLHGCQACNCVLYNTLYHNSSVCNDTSGQCSCKTYVGGQRCDRCDDNYFNTSRGCKECPVCYGLIQTHVRKLRSNIIVLDDMTKRLIRRFNAAGQRLFAQRLNEARANISQVFESANLTDNRKNGHLNDTLDGLGHLTATVALLMDKVDTLTRQQSDLEGLMNKSMNWTETAYLLLKDANSTIPFIQSLVKTIEDFVQPIENTTFNLEQLNETHWHISQNLSFISETQSKKIDLVLADVKTSTSNMTENIRDVLALQNETKATVRNGNEVKDLSANISNSAYDMLALSKDVFKNVKKLGVLIEVNRNLTSFLQTRNQTMDYSSLEKNASIAVDDARYQASRSIEIYNTSSELLVEARDAHSRARLANDSATTTLQDATKTLQILKQFQNRSEYAERVAHESLKQISATNETSQKTIANIQNVSKSIGDALNITNKAVEFANEAYKLSRNENQNVSTIHNRSAVLQGKKQPSVCSRDLMNSRRDYVNNRSQTLQPVLASCPGDEAENASKLASSAQAQSEGTVRDTAQTLQRTSDFDLEVTTTKEAVKDIQTLAASGTLPGKIQTQEESFERLREELRRLRQAKEEKAIYIRELKEKVEAMKSEVKDLESLRDSFRDLPPCGQA